MNIYDQLKQLQIIPDAFENWAIYRNQLTDYIINNSEKDSSLLILGAGPCNDYDLSKLCNYFGSVTLCDRDCDALDKAAISYNVNDKVSKIILDHVGISDDDYRLMVDRLSGAMHMAANNDQFLEIALLLYEALFNDSISDSIPIGKYDYIACVGIHSQLISMCAWIWQTFSSTLNIEDERVYDFIKKQNDLIVRKFNDNILSAFGKSAFIGLESARENMEGAIEGAHQAIIDLEAREGLIITEQYMTWPFSQLDGIVYNMKIMKVEK